MTDSSATRTAFYGGQPVSHGRALFLLADTLLRDCAAGGETLPGVGTGAWATLLAKRLPLAGAASFRNSCRNEARDLVEEPR